MTMCAIVPSLLHMSGRAAGANLKRGGGDADTWSMDLFNLVIGTGVGAAIVACLWEIAGLVSGLAAHLRHGPGSEHTP